MRRPRTFKRSFRKRTRGFGRGKRRSGYRRGGVVLLKTTVRHYIDLDASTTPPVGNIDIATSVSSAAPLPHNGAGYFTLSAIPSCQWDAYSVLYEQVQLRGVKVVWPVGPSIQGQLPAPFTLPEVGPVLHCFDADSAELEAYDALLSRANSSRRWLNYGRTKEPSMYMVPRTAINVQSAVGAMVARKRVWLDSQNANIFDVPFFGYKWYVSSYVSAETQLTDRFLLVTYWLAFRGPRGCQSVGQAIAKLKASPNVQSVELVDDDDCGCQ